MTDNPMASEIEDLRLERDAYRALAHDYAWAIWSTIMECSPHACSGAPCQGLACVGVVEEMLRGHCMVGASDRGEILPVAYFLRIEWALNTLRDQFPTSREYRKQCRSTYARLSGSDPTDPETWARDCDDDDDFCRYR